MFGGKSNTKKWLSEPPPSEGVWGVTGHLPKGEGIQFPQIGYSEVPVESWWHASGKVLN